ncbi:MAG: c-type cytochrome [Syntrophothermus sp.]
MDFLDKLVIPQSMENLILLKYILTMAMLLFIPFIGFMLIASAVSVFYAITGRKAGDSLALQFAGEVINIAVSSKPMVIILGIIPVITLMLSYTQLLHGSKIRPEGLLLLALVLLLAAFRLLFSYRYTFNLNRYLSYSAENIKDDSSSADAEGRREFLDFTQSNARQNVKYGIWGVVLLLLATYLVTASIQMSFDANKWSENNSILSIVFSIKVIIKYLYFLAVSISLSSAAALFYYFRLKADAEFSPMFRDFVRKIVIPAGVISAVVLPVFVLLNLLMVPREAVSNTFFLLTGLGMLLLFAIIHLFYALYKNWSSTYAAYIFYFMLLFFMTAVISDQLTFSYSSVRQDVVLAANYERIRSQQMEKAGLGPVVSGKEIFDGRCSACHRFDSKLVGPAYKDVLPKYEGKRDELIAFISNPVKKNPAFPPMPNQGLKPKEVEAIADYIMKTYKEK